MRRLKRNRMLAGFVAVAVALPAVVLATHTFSDVPDGTYYTAAVEWAADNGITTGTSATTFSPDDPVTRAQNVTFAHRYDQNILQPALDAIRQSPDRVAWVADDGTGDFLLLSTALASITDASASNPYVVRIAPGVYTETSPVALKTYVDVEGSGQGVTTITCECGEGSNDATAATVSAGDIAAEIRHLTIENTGGAFYSFGVWTEDVADGSVSMLHVTATATGGNQQSYGVYNWESSPSMMNVTATATSSSHNYGVYNSRSSPSMTNVVATATGDTDSGNYGVSNYEASPSMMNVTATASGTSGSYNFGVYNYDSSPSMTDVVATARGGDESFGVRNHSSSSPEMMNVSATGTGGTLWSWGVYNYDSSSPSVRASSLTGDSHSIYNDGTSSAMVADTMLGGEASGAGFTCLNTYTDAFVALDEDCAVIP